MAKMSQQELIFSYYKQNPNRDIPHAEVVDWATAEWKKLTGNVFRDPDRAIRKLYSMRLLIQVAKGVYRYDPTKAVRRELPPFTQQQKQAIFERDKYKCVVCGRGKREGVELHADHIRAQERGGESEVKNGMTLCGQHNYQKRAFSQTETGKKMFIRFYEIAKSENNERFKAFFRDLLEVYEKHGINGHIEWDDKP